MTSLMRRSEPSSAPVVVREAAVPSSAAVAIVVPAVVAELVVRAALVLDVAQELGVLVVAEHPCPARLRRPGGGDAGAVLEVRAALVLDVAQELGVLVVAEHPRPSSTRRPGGGDAGRRSRPWSPHRSTSKCSPARCGGGRGHGGRRARTTARSPPACPARPGALVVAMLVADRGRGRRAARPRCARRGERQWWCAGAAPLVAIALVAAVVAEHVTGGPARPGALVMAMR